MLYLSGAPQLVFDSNSSTVLTTTEGAIAVKGVSLSYDVATKKIMLPTVRLAVGEGNAASGIRTLMAATRVASGGFRWLPAICYSLPEFYTSTHILGESIGTGDGLKTGFKTAFPFVKSGAKVYVDGAEQTSGVTVDTGRPESNNKMGRFFKLLSTNYGKDIPNTTMPMPTATYGIPELGAYAIYENPFYALGIDSFVNQYTKVESSDDLENWTMVSDFETATVTVGSPSKYHRYWRITNHSVNGYTWRCYAFTSNSILANNINFASPPTTGAVITIDYDTESIAKDTNHVFDFSLEITLGEKTD